MQIRTKVAFSGVPALTRGEAERDGKLWKITWWLPNRPKPLVDWFDKDEFDRYLEVMH